MIINTMHWHSFELSKFLIMETLDFELDMRHIRIFLELYTSRNVSRTAELVGLSQSSVSVVLGQLRQHYDDPLFVRTSEGMQPTPRARTLEPALREAMSLLARSMVREPEFRPESIRRTFRLSMTDVGQMTLLPGLLSKIRMTAPHAEILVSNLSYETPRHLETGDCDLAMGFTDHIKAGFYQQKLFDEGFACIVSRNHPRIGETISLARLSKEPHAKVMLSATSHALIDRFLEGKGVQRNFSVRVPSFLGLSQIIATSELVAIVPVRLATIFAVNGLVRIVTPTVQFPSYSVNQYWHDRFHRDPANMWLRSIVYETATGLPLSQTGESTGFK